MSDFGPFEEILATASFYLHLISVPIIILTTAALVHLGLKVKAIRDEQRAELFPQGLESAGLTEELVTNPKWEEIVKQINSDNPNDWQAAIIKADMILDHLLDKMGYTGESLGAKLKQVEPSDFLTLDRAWAAHKVRNALAHEEDYALNHRRAQEAVENYRAVFEEFEYI